MTLMVSKESLSTLEEPIRRDSSGSSEKYQKKVIHQLLEKHSNTVAKVQQVLGKPSNQMQLHIFRKAFLGQSPKVSRILKQLVSRIAFVIISLRTIGNYFRERKLQRRLTKFLSLIGLTPCAPNLPMG